MNKKKSLIAALLLVFAAGAAVVAYRHYRPAAAATAETGIKYHCPMHPAYISDKPGECPICGMTLVPIEGTTPAGKKKMDMADMPSDAGEKTDMPAAPASKAPGGGHKIKFYRSPMNPSVT